MLDSCWTYTALLLCLSLSGLRAQTEDVHLSYTEEGLELFTKSAQQAGCYAHLDSYPHWCLGNISLCHNGLTVTAWVKSYSDIPPERMPDVLVTTGGHSANSDGFYIVRKYSDQYTVGVAVGERVWQSVLRLQANVWVILGFTWQETDGLTIYVDGLTQAIVNVPETRKVNPDYDGLASSIVVGVTEMGNPVSSDCTYDVDDIRVVNSRSTSDDFADLYNVTETLYQGCISSNVVSSQRVNDTTLDPETACRLHCHQNKNAYALVFKSDMCACVDAIDSSDLAHIGCEEKWQVYIVSHIKTGSDYRLRLNFVPQSKNSYTKPGEDILFFADVDYNLDVIYRFEFDDGVVITTTDSPVSHSWTLAGEHGVTVTTYIGIVQLSETLNVLVEDVDEGQAPDLVGLATGHWNESLTVQYSLTVADEHTTSCTLFYGDGQTSRPYSFVEYGSKVENHHRYKTCGFYKLEANCTNAYGNTSTELGFWARQLKTTYHYISTDQQNFSIPALGDTSFFQTLLVKVNNSDVDFTVEGRSTIVIRADVLEEGVENIVKIESRDIVLDRHIVSVRRPVMKPVISADRTSDAWSLTSRIMITLEPSDHVWMNIDFGNGDPTKTIYVPETKTKLPLPETAHYSGLGDYTITVKLYNEISEACNTLDISVEVPIQSLTVETNNITSLQENGIFKLDVNSGTVGPQKVLFYIDFGDGNHDEMFYRNSVSNGFEPLTISHRYVTWGIYRVQVVASNNISQEIDEVLIHIGQNMTFLDILTAKERVQIDGTLDFVVNCPTGSDVMYYLDFGDGTNFTVGELSGPENSSHSKAGDITEVKIVVTHHFAVSGYYNVKVTAANTFGTMQAMLCPTVVVAETHISDCSLPNVFFQDMETSVEAPLVRKRSEDTLLTVQADYDCTQNSSNSAGLTYSWKGVSLVSSAEGSYAEQSIYGYCGLKSKDNTLMVNALALPFGLYKLSVTVSPSNNDLLYTRKDIYIQIIQSEPVPIIDGDDVRTIMLYATAIFDISNSHDPDLVTGRRKDLSLSMFFTPEASLKEVKKWPLAALESKSSLITNRTLFPSTTSNTFNMYQYGSCFNNTAELLEDLSTYNGKVKFAADNFAIDQFSFGVILWAERNNLTAMTSQIVEVRSTNMSLEDLGSLLDLALNADPDTAIRLCGGAASTILNQDASSADEQEKLAESTEAVVKTLGSVANRIDSPNQAAKCASAIKTMTSNKDIVSEGSRSSAAGAFVSLANGTSSMGDATVDDASSFAGECLGGLGNIFPTSPEEKKAPKRSSTTEEMSTTTELLGLMTKRLANDSDDYEGYTTPFTTPPSSSSSPQTTKGTSTSIPPTTATSPTTITTTRTTTRRTTTTTTPAPTTTTTTVITTPTTTTVHMTVGTTLSPSIRASFTDNGDNYTISGITVATLQLNASKDYITPTPFTTTMSPTTMTTTLPPTTTPVTIPIHPRMFNPRTDFRTSYEIAEETLNQLPEKKTYDELLDYIFDDCLLFRKVMKTPDIQYNCPCISAEAINMMKCDGDFSLQDRVFDIMTYYEHPDDLYEAYLVPLNKARKARDLARKATDKEVATAGQNALGTVADTVGDKTSEEDRTERAFETPRLGMKLAKVGFKNSTNSTDGDGSAKKQSMQMPVGGFDMPSGVLQGSAGDCPNVNTMFMGDSDNPYTFAEGENSVGKGVLSLGYSCNGEKVKVEGSEEPILLWMDRDASMYEHSLFVLLTNTKKDVWTNFNYHPVNLTDKNASLQVVLDPQDSMSAYYVYIKYGDRPNMTHYDFIGSTPNDEATLVESYNELNDTQKEQLRYSVTLPLELTAENGTYWIGIKFKSGNLEIEDTMANTSYTLLMLVSGCRFFDETNDTWSSEGCQVGPLTTKYKTQCFCDHLTSFGSDSAVAPNTIDFNNVWAKFGNISENAAVFSTVISLIGIYIILLIWLRHMDKKDLVKWGAMPLEDNLPTDSYHYQVTIQTGVKREAGTGSQVRFIVSGEEADSGVRRLAVADGQRKHLPRGSILNYVMSVDACLGPLTFLRIWHDNSGKGKNQSWYLDQVQINDLQTGEKFIFLCDRWLAVEQDDGMVDRILPVAGIDDLIAFKQLFSSSARKKLANDHLWVSVFSRPTRSNFTRVQRLSCCMSLLFLTMITNAMWFKGDTSEEKQVEAIKLGPFSFTLAQFFISFAATIIVFPPSFIMMTFFRRCRPKNNAISQANQPVVKDRKKFRWKNVSSNSMIWGPKTKKSRMGKLKESVSNILSLHKKNKYTDTLPEEEDRDDDVKMVKPKKKKPWSLPHWCIYIAWILCFFSIVTSGFFTILYSMQWGKEKANEWLTTFLLSFFQSVIIVQPVKVLLLVAFIACILKKPDLDEEDLDEDINRVLAGGDHAPAGRDEASLFQIMLQRRSDNSEFQPPDPEQLEKSRQNRLMEIKMEAVLKEILIYTFFLGIIFFLSYQQRDPQSYFLGDTVRKNMFSGHDKIKTVLDYWVWLEGTFLPSVYALKYANGSDIKYWQDAACISDMESRRVGVVRLRQHRIKNDTCTILPELRSIINHCRDEYSWTDDDTKPYLPYWVKPPGHMVEKLEDSEDPFVYQNSVKLKNAPYVGTLATYKGGGYVILTKRLFCRTKVILDRARTQNWLDLNTKAIFLEYTVYNPNVNLFASVTALTEFLTTGSTTSRVEVKVFRLMSYIGGFGVIVLIVEILFGIITLYFFYQCVKKVRALKWGYFKDFWSLLEFVLLCFAVACIVLYAFKHILTEVAMRALHNRKSDGFVNFNSIALYDEMYGYIMAVVVFMATIQFLKLLQFNKKMGMLGSTVKLAANDLKVFSITFFLYFGAFTATAFLLFGNALMTYQNVVTAAESMFAFALGSFDYEAMTAVQPFWGPIFFFSYIAVVYIGLMSIFLTIIGDSFTQVKENVALQSNDYEIVEFMWKKIKGLFS